jgi:beta-N-acetylhexosaminidase
VELVPFREVFAKAPPALVMTAHVLYRGVDPDRPGTLSPVVIERLLRDELGYQGVVVTDDLEMKALADRYSIEEIVRLGLEAGVDVFLCCKEEERWLRAEAELERLLVDSVVSPERIQRSVRRIARAKGPLRDALVPDVDAASRVLRCAEHQEWLAQLDAACGTA